MVFSVWKIRAFLPRARLLRIVADLPNSIARHLMFQLSTSSRCFCCGSFPSAPHRGHVPIVVRRLARFPGASRHSCSHSRHRCSHSQTRHRHSRSHCCTRDRPRGLWETLPGCKVTHSRCKKNGRALHNEPKRHRNDASEHCAGPVYPVPLTAVELVFEFET